MLERGTNQCILGRPFETVTRMARQTLNNGAVRITIFDQEDDSIQTTFQPYSPGDPGDMKGRSMVELPCGLKALKSRERNLCDEVSALPVSIISPLRNAVSKLGGESNGSELDEEKEALLKKFKKLISCVKGPTFLKHRFRP